MLPFTSWRPMSHNFLPPALLYGDGNKHALLTLRLVAIILDLGDHQISISSLSTLVIARELGALISRKIS